MELLYKEMEEGIWMPLESVIRPRIHSSFHFKARLKNRLKIKNSHKRRVFVKRASEQALSIKELPKQGFSFFLRYMKRKEQKVQKGNPNLKLFIYLDWLILADVTSGELVTIYKVSRRWYGIYPRLRLKLALESDNPGH